MNGSRAGFAPTRGRVVVRSAFRAIVGLLGCLVAVAVLGLGAGGAGGSVSGLSAYFAKRSYARGATAELVVRTDAPRMSVQILQVGPERIRTRRSDLVNGVPVTPELTFDLRPGRREHVVRVPLYYWPSGVYFARLRTRARVAFAPVVLRPRRLGETRALVVVPTNTWQAYNLRDEGGDGVGDSWYASESITTVRFDRPFLDRGVPPRFRQDDLGFLHWLSRSGNTADFLSDDDLERLTSSDLLRFYDLVVFAGHEEYVSAHVYTTIERFRDGGGNLLFLSANNFFRRIYRGHDTITRGPRWRDVGRPEAGLVGVEYVDWNENHWPSEPLVITGASYAPWLFAGTRLNDGSRFGKYGIEIDARTGDSPPGVHVLAHAPDIFGTGRTAEMVYYETPSGAKVFAAGVLNFGGTADFPIVSRLVDNLWRRLALP